LQQTFTLWNLRLESLKASNASLDEIHFHLVRRPGRRFRLK
jgi:hypothetical protein